MKLFYAISGITMALLAAVMPVLGFYLYNHPLAWLFDEAGESGAAIAVASTGLLTYVFGGLATVCAGNVYNPEGH